MPHHPASPYRVATRWLQAKAVGFHGFRMTPQQMRMPGPQFSDSKPVSSEDIEEAADYLEEVHPGLLVAYSRGGAVAMLAIRESGVKPKVIWVAPAWQRGWANVSPPSTSGVILHGDKDNSVPLQHSCQLAQKTGLPLRVVPDRNHISILKDKTNQGAGVLVPRNRVNECVQEMPDWGSSGHGSKQDVEKQQEFARSLKARVIARFLVGATTPLPDSFPKTEYGLMTQDEFMNHMNPKKERHPSTAYDNSLKDLNPSFTGPSIVTDYWSSQKGNRYVIRASDDGFLIQLAGGGPPVAVIHNGTLYHSTDFPADDLPTDYQTMRGRDKGEGHTRFDIQRTKAVRDISEVIGLADDTARKNLKRYNKVIQRLLIQSEPLTIRSEGSVQRDKGTTLAILNAEGLVVAQASNEWSTSLVMVVREYRGKGLGKTLTKLWYDLNPSWTSGGFTPAGWGVTRRVWEDRVREFLSKGWYSELVREGRLSRGRAKEILDSRP